MWKLWRNIFLSASKVCIRLLRGNRQALPDGFMERTKALDKIMFLAMIPEELPNQKVKAFLEIVLSYHQLSKETIAKMAGIKVADVDRFLNDQWEKTDAEIKYKIAAVTMALRFFLKDNEPEQ